MIIDEAVNSKRPSGESKSLLYIRPSTQNVLLEGHIRDYRRGCQLKTSFRTVKITNIDEAVNSKRPSGESES